MRAVVAALVVAALLAGTGSAHRGGAYWTERQAGVAALPLAKVARADADQAVCYGTDRPRQRNGVVLFRHFFCFISKVIKEGDNVLTEPVERFELHVLGDGTAISRHHVLNWESTGEWIDDRPQLNLAQLRGRSWAEAARVLRRRGFAPVGFDEAKSYAAAGDRRSRPRGDVRVCDVKPDWGVGRVTVLLFLAYPRCAGPPYLPPRVPRLVGRQFRAAALIARPLGINFYGVFRDDYVLLRGRESWLVCGQDPRPGQRSWEMRLVVAPRC